MVELNHTNPWWDTILIPGLIKELIVCDHYLITVLGVRVRIYHLGGYVFDLPRKNNAEVSETLRQYQDTKEYGHRESKPCAKFFTTVISECDIFLENV